ncbi:MAG TPA: branched-chain amino acid ABC transporter permease, partial [Pyrodictium sp.]|nr:branched-chain amino acid ABC transporter permease [Pyrodictium sp.]
AGGLMSFVLRVNPATGSLEVVSVFAASIVGGLQSLLGGVVGGYLVGLSETVGTRLLGELLGITGIAAYRKVVSLALIVVVLLVVPEGIMGVDWRSILRKLKNRAKGERS